MPPRLALTSCRKLREEPDLGDCRGTYSEPNTLGQQGHTADTPRAYSPDLGVAVEGVEMIIAPGYSPSPKAPSD